MRYRDVHLTHSVTTRYEVKHDGGLIDFSRDDPDMMYGSPLYADGLAYIWPESPDRFVIALTNEVQLRPFSREYCCYHVAPTLDAATMFVLLTR